MNGFEWRDYLRVAGELRTGAVDDARLRSAISRASYAVLGTGRERLARHGWAGERGNVHHQVWRAYLSAQRADCREIGHLGFTLRDIRNHADDTRPWRRPEDLGADATKAVGWTDRAIRLLDLLDDDERCFR